MRSLEEIKAMNEKATIATKGEIMGDVNEAQATDVEKKFFPRAQDFAKLAKGVGLKEGTKDFEDNKTLAKSFANLIDDCCAGGETGEQIADSLMKRSFLEMLKEPVVTVNFLMFLGWKLNDAAHGRIDLGEDVDLAVKVEKPEEPEETSVPGCCGGANDCAATVAEA